jgi:hypothetical protein
MQDELNHSLAEIQEFVEAAGPDDATVMAAEAGIEYINIQGE